MTRHFVTDVPTGTTTEDPADKSHLGFAEHEASARALEAAGQNPAAIQSWHRAIVSHARAGNLAGVIGAVKHCERLAGNQDFAPDLERKSTAADAALERAEQRGFDAAYQATRAASTAAATDWRSQPRERVGEGGDGPIEPAIERVGDRQAQDASKPDANTTSGTPERL
ncbi:MAG: hypothetical protein WBP56_14465 [Polyangia bacterium]